MRREVRDDVVRFVRDMSTRTGISIRQLLAWIGLAPGRYYDWRKRVGRSNRHNGLQPRSFWLLDWERDAIIRFALEHPLDGYRRLTYMMIDADVVAVSPSSVYRVLKQAGLLGRADAGDSRKGTGFKQPGAPHRHWHIDVSYLNIAGTFYYLCAILDGYSRFIVHWDIREHMRERDVEIILQRAAELYPEARPRMISDNGPQFVAREFKVYIRIMGMTHVRTAPYYPQSNGKIERWHQSLKREAIRPKVPLNFDDAKRIVAGYVSHYNTIRLHGAIGYVTPADKLNGRDQAIFAERQRKLAAAETCRKLAAAAQTARAI